MSWDGNCWRNLTWPYRRLMIIVVPLKPQNFKSASSTFQRVLELSVHLEFSLIKNPKEPDKTAARPCKFCGYKHPVTQPSHCPAFGKQCLKCKKEDHFSQVCPRNVKEGSKVDSLQQESPQERKKDTQNVNKEVYTYFGSIELGTVSRCLEIKKELYHWLKGRMLNSKQTQVQRPMSFPNICIRKSPIEKNSPEDSATICFVLHYNLICTAWAQIE